MTRAEKIAEAQRLRAQGLTLREIGERMGRSLKTVHDLRHARAETVVSELERSEHSASHAAQRNYSIAVDFDGVIHTYTSPWVSAEVIPDPPVPGAIEWLNEISRKFKVIIFTTRGKTADGRYAVEEFLRDHGYVGSCEVTAEKPPALIYLDDRAVRFDGEHFPSAEQIHREYVPWNKDRRS